MSEQLSPCPFCGSAGEELGLCYDVGATPAEGQDWFVRCYVCHVETARQDSEAEAIAAWNRRAARSHESERVKGLVDFARRILSYDREALANHRPKGGLADCVDNRGRAYQSHALADALDLARSALSAIPGEAVLAGEGKGSVGFQPCAETGPCPSSPELLSRPEECLCCEGTGQIPHPDDPVTYDCEGCDGRGYLAGGEG
jgi:Lar family restriction alleviation protein